MLVVISPAKKLDWTMRQTQMTQPIFANEANELAQVARELGAEGLARLMRISDDLARLNAQRFADYEEDPKADTLRPAALAFAGDTYQGLEAGSLDLDEMSWAQDHLRILSGLYGVLRPLDGIQPYRLEMGIRLATNRGKTLYDWWKSEIAQALNMQAETLGTEFLVNCASQEYFGAVDLAALKLRVITPVFMEDKPGGPKIVSFHAKRARGAMARYVITHRIDSQKALKDFDSGGYKWTPDLSTPDRPVFLR